ncbi:hypothetical protein, partial [Enterobacter cloacae complex sp.6730051]|uniref:hypothetical protein n=1 Tax=Enterobacter cloacae complex sp.6730051 TaxID=3397172 RepID=UPI003AF9FF5F
RMSRGLGDVYKRQMIGSKSKKGIFAGCLFKFFKAKVLIFFEKSFVTGTESPGEVFKYKRV